jgi:hypothetical protein
MAVLTPAQLAAIRREVLGETAATVTKPVLNTAIQQAEDALPTAFAAITGAITGPWTQAQKRRIARVVLTQRVLELLG